MDLKSPVRISSIDEAGKASEGGGRAERSRVKRMVPETETPSCAVKEEHGKLSIGDETKIRGK